MKEWEVRQETSAEVKRLRRAVSDLEVENSRLHGLIRDTLRDLQQAHLHSRVDLVHEASFKALQRLQSRKDKAT